MNPIELKRVLISLHRGYGLGDAVQMSAVLRHVRKHRPNWHIDFQAEEGRECVGRGIAHNVFCYGQPYPSDHYDAEVQILLYDTWHGYTDRPNTRVSSCLRERFGLDWDAECGRYEINVSERACHDACQFLDALRREPTRTVDAELALGEPYPSQWLRYPIVAVHYQGDSAAIRKNLTHEQACTICAAVESRGRLPLIIDWRALSKAGAYPRVEDRGMGWGGNAEMNCAVIARCEAFIGIDSGPSKCASATETPSLIIWTGHHPVAFHDPAPNTTHLVPVGYHTPLPVCDNPEVIKWFEANYNVRVYDGDPCAEVETWLQEVLR